MPARLLLLALFFASATCYAQAGGGGGDSGGTSVYVQIKPAFVVNVADGEEVHHLQLSISFIPTEPGMESAITDHEPAIRHAIVVLISGRQVAEISHTQGKIALREQIQETVNKVLEENTGKPGIKRTLFTGFLIQ